MSDTLYYFNEPGYKMVMSRIEQQILPLIQSVIEEYKKLGLQELQSSDLDLLFTKIEDLVFDKITEGKALELNGVKIKREYAKTIVQFPEEYSLFKAIVSEKTKLLEGSFVTLPGYKILLNRLSVPFEINQSQTVVLKNDVRENIAESFKKYARTDTQKAVLAFANDILASYEKNGIQKVVGHSGNGVFGLMKQIFDHPYNQKIQIKEEGISFY